jgi:hypothetical protein
VRDARLRATCVGDTVDALDRYPFLATAPVPETGAAAAGRSTRGQALSTRCRERGWKLVAGPYQSSPADVAAIVNTIDRGGAVVGDVPLRPPIAASFDCGVLPVALRKPAWQFGRHCLVIVCYCTELHGVLDPVTQTPVTAAGDVWHIYESEGP